MDCVEDKHSNDWNDGEKMNWITKELPPLKEVVVGGNTFLDDTERMDFIREVASQIKERIGKGKLS